MNFDLSGVVGVLVSHEHGDHACSVKDFLKFGKRIYCTTGTAIGARINKGFSSLEYLQPKGVGLFRVTPFKVFHDAKEPAGFLIEFEGNRLAFITDTSDLQTRLKKHRLLAD